MNNCLKNFYNSFSFHEPNQSHSRLKLFCSFTDSLRFKMCIYLYLTEYQWRSNLPLTFRKSKRCSDTKEARSVLYKSLLLNKLIKRVPSTSPSPEHEYHSTAHQPTVSHRERPPAAHRHALLPNLPDRVNGIPHLPW